MMKKVGAVLLSGVLSLSMAVCAIGQEATAEVRQQIGINHLVSGTRQADVRDIVLSEAEAGVFKKNKHIYLRADHLKFENGLTVEITEGDVKVKKVEADGDTLVITIEKESTEPSVITLKDVKLYLDGSLAEGLYSLDLVTEESEDYPDNIFGASYGKNDEKGKYSTSSIELMPDFAKVDKVLQPYEVDNRKEVTLNMITNQLAMDGNEFTLKQPFHISEEGSTSQIMVPVRALTQMYPDDISITWDDDAKTATVIVFRTKKTGDKIISLKVDSQTMVEHGIAIPMHGKVTMLNNSIFIPLNDFGYILGCDESDITWNPDTGIATLRVGKVGK